MVRKALTVEQQHKRQARERVENIRAIQKRKAQEELDKKRKERIKSLEVERNLIVAEKRLKAVKKKKGIGSLFAKKKKHRSSSW